MKRHASKELSIPQPDWQETIVQLQCYKSQIFRQLKSHDGVQCPTLCTEMINSISVGSDYLLHDAFNDEAWKILMQQHSMSYTVQR
jgi:hypothetical protein